MGGAPPTFGVLGALEVRRDGREVTLPRGRQRAVLAALLVRSGRPVSAAGLAAAAWGDGLPEHPAAALHTVVSRLRRPLGAASLRTGPLGYALVVPPEQLDAGQFVALRASAARARPEAAAQLLDAALALWRGPAYEEFAHRDFARAEAVRLDQLRAVTIEERAELSLALGQSEPAISSLEWLLAEQPFRERATALLMTALYESGRAAAALDRYRGHRDRLADELGLDPSPALQQLQVRILGHDLPASRRPAPRMPAWLVSSTAFVGRDDDLAALAEAVRAHRLVTVTGAGGVGKTRLVAETLPDLAARLGLPVTVVELGDPGGGQVDAAVAAALGLGVAGGSVTDAVLEYLSITTLLLVLDSCENAVAQVRRLVEAVLRRCPGVRMIATSRRRLDSPDEQVLPLEPLATPRADAPPEQAGLAASVQLFADRARRLRPALPLTAETLPVAADICRRLDGLPLAIELAATQAATLGLQPLRDRLDVSLDVLGDDEHRPGLRAVVDGSYALLGSGDQRVLAALSVFDNGFDLPAVEHVAGSLVPGPLASSLARLVDASLVLADLASGEARYRLLAIVRAFAAERLARAGAADAVRLAHARYVRALADTAARAATGRASRERPFQPVEDSRSDVVAAVRCAISAGDLALAGGITASLRRYPHWRPDTELLALIREVAHDPRLRPTPAAVLAIAAGGVAAADLGDLGDAEQLGAEALALADDPAEHYLALLTLGVTALYRGEHDRSAAWWQRMLDVPDLPAAYRVDAHASLALLGCYHGDRPASRRHAEEARRAADVAGAAGYHAFAAYAYGEVCLLDDPPAAVDVLRVAADEAEQAGAGQVVAVARIALLSGLVRLGRYDEALSLAPALLHHLRQMGSWPQLWTTVRVLAELLVDLDRPQPAAMLLAAAHAADSAPTLTGDDVGRYRDLDARIRQRLGVQVAERIAALARALPRSQVLDRALAAVDQVVDRLPVE